MLLGLRCLGVVARTDGSTRRVGAVQRRARSASAGGAGDTEVAESPPVTSRPVAAPAALVDRLGSRDRRHRSAGARPRNGALRRGSAGARGRAPLVALDRIEEARRTRWRSRMDRSDLDRCGRCAGCGRCADARRDAPQRPCRCCRSGSSLDPWTGATHRQGKPLRLGPPRDDCVRDRLRGDERRNQADERRCRLPRLRRSGTLGRRRSGNGCGGDLDRHDCFPAATGDDRCSVDDCSTNVPPDRDGAAVSARALDVGAARRRPYCDRASHHRDRYDAPRADTRGQQARLGRARTLTCDHGRVRGLTGTLAIAATWFAPAPAPVFAPLADALGLQRKLSEHTQDVAITFDDGPHREGTPAILELLRGAGARATFFLVGEQVDRYPELAAEIAAAGHEIGLHGYRHFLLLRRTVGDVASDLDRALDTIVRAAGQTPSCYRPPYGVFSSGALELVWRRGWQPVLWSKWGRDWTRRATPSSIARNAVRGLAAGDIVLLHDADHYSSPGSWRKTVAALPRVLETADRLDLRWVPLSPR